MSAGKDFHWYDNFPYHTHVLCAWLECAKIHAKISKTHIAQKFIRIRHSRVDGGQIAFYHRIFKCREGIAFHSICTNLKFFIELLNCFFIIDKTTMETGKCPGHSPTGNLWFLNLCICLDQIHSCMLCMNRSGSDHQLNLNSKECFLEQKQRRNFILTV